MAKHSKEAGAGEPLAEVLEAAVAQRPTGYIPRWGPRLGALLVKSEKVKMVK